MVEHEYHLVQVTYSPSKGYVLKIHKFNRRPSLFEPLRYIKPGQY